MIQDHLPITIGPRMMGLFDRGNKEACPLDHFIECQNIEFIEDGIKRRESFSNIPLQVANLKRIHFVKFSGQEARLLYLVNDGATSSLYSYNFTLASSTLLLTGSVSRIDFNVVEFNNRAYISFIQLGGSFASYRGSGQVYVWDSSTIRLAAGSAPSTAFSAANSATAGLVTAGYHGLAYAYETDTGFITPPKKIPFASLFNATGAKKIDLTGILNGPAGTVKKHILATRSYDASSEPEPEFFFIDDEVINDNTTTSKTIDFGDQELIRSADYLFNEYDQIPAGATIGKYNNRMVIGGIINKPSLVIISKAGEPESFDQVTGFTQADPEESEYVSNLVEYRGQLIITKDSRAYSIADNGFEPVEWGSPIAIEGGIGSTPFGIASILDAKKGTLDSLVIASRSGLHAFNGSFSSLPLSYKIESLWKTITTSVFPIVQTLVDSRKSRIYCGVPLAGAGAVNRILVCDYSLGLTPDLVRWTIWELSGGSTFGMGFRLQDSTGDAVLYIGTSLSNHIKWLNSAETTSDTGNPAIIRTAYINSGYELGQNHFAAYRAKVNGDAIITTTAYGQDDTTSKALPSLTTIPNMGKEVTRRILFTAEKMSLKLSFAFNYTSWTLQNLVIFSKQLWRNRPYA